MTLNVLLIIYGCLSLIDLVFMLSLHFLHDRSGYYKTAAGVWLGIFLAFLADGYIDAHYELLTHVFAVPLISITIYSFAKLSQDLYKIELPMKRLMLFSGITWVIGATLHFVFAAPFVVSSFVICLGIVAPGVLTAYRLFKSSTKFTIIDRLFSFVVAAEAIHILDYPFLRNVEGAAVFGFSFGLFLVYVASMLIPVVINRRISADLNELLEHKVAERTEQLTEVKEKLVSAAKMSALGEMAGGIAHEINTPLAVIKILGEQARELLEEDPIDKKEVSRMILTINSTVKKIGTIVQGLRVFARDGGDDQFSAVSVNQIIESTLSLCQEKLKHADIKIRLGPIPDDFQILCRQVQISQVLLNLISNSCDAIAPLTEKWIQVDAKKAGVGIQISVTDSGSGITEAARKRLFQPFFTTKEIGKGTGLGLSISKGIMEIHGGSLRIDDDCKNTRFVIECPIPTQAQSQDEKSA